MSVKNTLIAWSGLGMRRAATARRLSERFPTHSRVVLPDGRIMLTRVASLTAAKDLLAAERAAARRDDGR